MSPQGATAFLLTKITDPPPILSNTKMAGRANGVEDDMAAEPSNRFLSPSSSSARLVDLKILTSWLDEQSEWSKDYYEGLDEIFDDLDYVIPGTFINKPSTVFY
ncbi:hypothetical protein FOA43_003239 [Brettanomyces nanus]|uniref:Uncharacterized protein n=1 Tax=Eeniella nana TaxID=13502 RepID=A0A875S6A3_EENNA|nr:uncharacterized protein FOA43_003239 [Brettanomyces nanus]QPG75855.1 hypothetical protein FOA43_003239 [Brettanomyces nanus]